MKDNILVIAAHPDDEVLGCGGTIARHAAQGDKVSVVILGKGALSRDIKDKGKSLRLLAALNKASRHASRILGANRIFFENLPDNRFDELPLLDIVKIVEKYINRTRPTIIYTHFSGDLNIDHQITYRATATAARPLPASDIRAIYLFEVPSSTGWLFSCGEAFKPNHFVNISGFMEKKLSAFKKYVSEIRPFPHPRSLKGLKALAEYRGSTVGREFCEAFVIDRSII